MFILPLVLDKLPKTAAVGFPALAVVALAGARIFSGSWTLSLLGIYAAIPLISMPVVYHLTSNPIETSVSFFNFDSRLWLSTFCIAFGAATYFGRTHPRPSIFFILCAIAFLSSVGYGVKKSPVVTMVLLSSIIVLYHLSTTLGPALFLGSGDAPAIQIGIENTIKSGEPASTSGYSTFPAHYILALTISILLEVTDPQLVMYALGSLTLVISAWSLSAFGTMSGLISRRYAFLTPAIALTMFDFWYVGVYSLPRSLFAHAAVLPLALVVGLTIGCLEYNNPRWPIILIVLLFGATFFHKVAQIWVIATVITLLIGIKLVIYNNDERNLQLGLGTIVVSMLIFTTVWLYLITDTAVVPYLFTLFNQFGSIGSPSSRTFVLADPLGLLSTFLGSSLVLIFLFAGLSWIFRHGSSEAKSMGVATALLSIGYFPGPLHMSSTIMSFISIYRFAKIVLPFVAVIAALGFLRLIMVRNQRVLTTVMILLFLGSGLTFANDLYARDNPVRESGTFTNYFNQNELAAMNFAGEHSGLAYGDSKAYSYIDKFSRLPNWDTGWRTNETAYESNFEIDSQSLCNGTFIYRSGEIERRGSLITPIGRITDRNQIPNYDLRGIVYNAGESQMFPKC